VTRGRATRFTVLRRPTVRHWRTAGIRYGIPGSFQGGEAAGARPAAGQASGRGPLSFACGWSGVGEGDLSAGRGGLRATSGRGSWAREWRGGRGCPAVRPAAGRGTWTESIRRLDSTCRLAKPGEAGGACKSAGSRPWGRKKRVGDHSAGGGLETPGPELPLGERVCGRGAASVTQACRFLPRPRGPPGPRRPALGRPTDDLRTSRGAARKRGGPGGGSYAVGPRGVPGRLLERAGTGLVEAAGGRSTLKPAGGPVVAGLA